MCYSTAMQFFLPVSHLIVISSLFHHNMSGVLEGMGQFISLAIFLFNVNICISIIPECNILDIRLRPILTQG